MADNEEIRNLKQKLEVLSSVGGSKQNRFAVEAAADGVGQYFFKPLAMLTKLAGSGLIAHKKPNCPEAKAWWRYVHLGLDEKEQEFMARHCRKCRLCRSREKFVVGLLLAEGKAEKINRDRAELLFRCFWQLAEKTIDSVEYVEEE